MAAVRRPGLPRFLARAFPEAVPGIAELYLSHGGAINAAVGHLLGLSYDMFFLPANTALTGVRALGEERALAALNDDHHLRAGEAPLVASPALAEAAG